MASTVLKVIGEFRRRYPNCDQPRAKDLFFQAHREILLETRCREETISVSLTDGTRLYDLSSTALLVLGADYMTSATANPKPLQETHLDDLDEDSRGHRARLTEGTPSRYFLRHPSDSDTSELQIGFDPIPDTTTSSGYPIVRVYAIKEADLTNFETVPPMLKSDEVYLSVMCRDYALEADHQKYPFWHEVAKAHLAENVRFVRDRLDRLDTRLRPDYKQNRMV